MLKAEIRKHLKLVRNTLDENEITQKSLMIMSNVLSLSQVIDSSVVFIYNSYKKEVSTVSLIKRLSLSKTVYIPVMVENEMQAVLPIGFKTIKNRYGIEEPFEYQIGLKPIDVAIIPLIACDRQGNRIGFGNGNYDKFLQNNNCLKIGICFDFQLVENFVADEYDIPLDIIVTEKEIIKVKRPNF